MNEPRCSQCGKPTPENHRNYAGELLCKACHEGIVIWGDPTAPKPKGTLRAERRKGLPPEMRDGNYLSKRLYLREFNRQIVEPGYPKELRSLAESMVVGLLMPQPVEHSIAGEK